MVENGHALALVDLMANEGDDLFGEVERVHLGVENGGCAADTSGLPIFGEIGICLQITSQNRGCDLRIPALHRFYQSLDKPSRSQRSVALKIDHNVRIFAQNRHRIHAAFGPVGAAFGGHHNLGPKAARMVGNPPVIGLDRLELGRERIESGGLFGDRAGQSFAEGVERCDRLAAAMFGIGDGFAQIGAAAIRFGQRAAQASPRSSRGGKTAGHKTRNR